MRVAVFSKTVIDQIGAGASLYASLPPLRCSDIGDSKSLEEKVGPTAGRGRMSKDLKMEIFDLASKTKVYTLFISGCGKSLHGRH